MEILMGEALESCHQVVNYVLEMLLPLLWTKIVPRHVHSVHYLVYQDLCVQITSKHTLLDGFAILFDCFSVLLEPIFILEESLS